MFDSYDTSLYSIIDISYRLFGIWLDFVYMYLDFIFHSIKNQYFERIFSLELPEKCTKITRNISKKLDIVISLLRVDTSFEGRCILWDTCDISSITRIWRKVPNFSQIVGLKHQ